MAKVRHTPRFETCPFTFGRSPRGALSHDSDRSTMRLTHERSTAMKRRHFLKVAAATAFGFHVVPRSVLGGPRFVLPEGRVLTAYYAQRIDGHDRYHMGVVVWDPPVR